MKNRLFHPVSGQITVFSAVIMLSVLMLAGVLVDAARISTGRTMVKRAADTSAKALLADYGSKMKENYGIFVMSQNDEEDLEACFEEYLAANLSIPMEEVYYNGRTDLFGFRIERVHVTPVFNLSENPVMKQQILEYMKFRAPAELVEGFMERLSAVKDVGKMSEAYKKKVGIDKILGSMDKSQQKLKKTVDGSGNTGEKFINGFNLGGCWEAAYNEYQSQKASLSSLKSSLDSVNSSISTLEYQRSQLDAGKETDSSGTGSGGDGQSGSGGGTGSTEDKESDKEDELDSQIEQLEEERSTLQQSCNDTISRLQQQWSDLRNGLTQDYVKANENAIEEIKKIAEKGKKAQQAISELETYMNENFANEDGAFSGDFKVQTQAELESLRALILDGQRAEEMLDSAGSNRSILQSIVTKLDEAGIGSDDSGTPAGGLPSELLNIVRSYINISYDYSKPAKGDKSDDPRAGKADAVKEFIVEKILKDTNYKTEGIDEKELPSITKVVTESFFESDQEFINGSQTDSGSVGRSGGEAKYAGDLANIDAEVDLYNEEGMFQENALGFIADIGRLVAGEAAALRDSIYLNEYIMGTFKNSVPDLVEENETVKDTNLHGTEKNTLETFYDSEVEYILHGNASQKVNNIMTKGELLLVRFGLNTLHVYTDAKKKTMATSTATAVAGWWTGGAGIPILSNLIMCGWGMGEAVLDVRDLMEGKSVPVYKMKGDWRLDVGLPAAAEPKTDRRLYFNYHDYLRLFLLTMNEDKKLDRVEDLIQLNMDKSNSGFRMSGCNTYVRVEAEVSMKYLFITQPFIRNAMKTEDERIVFKVLVYEGY